MRLRRSSLVLGVSGLLLVVLATLGKLVLVPMVTRLPANTGVTVDYTGTATLLDEKALLTGDTASAMRSDVPVTVTINQRVMSTAGDTAVVRESVVARAPGARMPSATYTYAVDRSTMLGVSPPEGVRVEPADGALTVTFPIGPRRNGSYRFYDPVTRTVVPVSYAGTDTRRGRPVNVYKLSADGPVKDTALLRGLPSGVPKSLLPSFAPLLPANLVAAVTPQAVAMLADPVPLTYGYKTTIVQYVDQQTGIAIDQEISQRIVATTSFAGQNLELLPVVTLDFHTAPASIEDLAEKATWAGRLLILIRLIAPIVLLAVGLLLIGGAAWRSRPAARPDRSSTSHRGDPPYTAGPPVVRAPLPDPPLVRDLPVRPENRVPQDVVRLD